MKIKRFENTKRTQNTRTYEDEDEDEEAKNQVNKTTSKAGR